MFWNFPALFSVMMCLRILSSGIVGKSVTHGTRAALILMVLSVLMFVIIINEDIKKPKSSVTHQYTSPAVSCGCPFSHCEHVQHSVMPPAPNREQMRLLTLLSS
jgi:hypothetical protein